GPMRSWIIALWRRSFQVRRAATLKRKPTMTRILTIVETIRSPMRSSLGQRRADVRLRRHFHREQARADVLEAVPRRLAAERSAELGEELPRRLARAERLDRLVRDLA